ncbi:hypothetical protein T11_1857, partial [Trichinella zimbabwensis]
MIIKYSRLSTFAVCTFRRNRECRISTNICRFCSYTPPMPYNPTQLPESCKGYHGPSTDLQVKYLSRIYFFIPLIDSFMHYVFTQILHYSHAVLHCASFKAEVWTFPDMSGPVDQSGSSVWNRGTGAAVNQLPVRSASFPFTLIPPVWLSRYHYCYGVEPHKQKQPCTKPADPQHTCTL